MVAIKKQFAQCVQHKRDFIGETPTVYTPFDKGDDSIFVGYLYYLYSYVQILHLFDLRIKPDPFIYTVHTHTELHPFK